LRVQATNSRPGFEVTADGTGVVGHAGVALLGELADRLELTWALGWRAAREPSRRHRHQASQVLRDLAVVLADGGDCLSDLSVLRDQPELFGSVASTPTAWRALERVARDPDGLAGLRAARAHARARAWQHGAHPDGELLLVDVDATLIDAHSDKEGAAGTFKHGFGFHPLLAFLDRGDGTAEPLAGILREGNAAANTACDLVELADLALAQLPKAAREQPVLIRCDSAGASHQLVGHLRERGVGFSVGFDLDERVRAAILATPEAAWQPAIEPDGVLREGAEVVELTGRVNLARWPEGTRLICRREDPHPGAQLCFSDVDGHRFQAFITDQPDPDITAVELRHRQHARVEQRIRGAKATGLRNLPFDRFRRNAVWVELVLLALALVAWAQVLLLDGELRLAEPKALRYRLWHQAARLARHARRVIVRLQRCWPWAGALLAAFARLRALPLRR
jgi:Transposase DDE domain group 1